MGQEPSDRGGASCADPPIAKADKPNPRWRRWLHWLRRGFRVLVFFVLVYAVIVLVGLIPVNNSFQPAKRGVEIMVVSNAVHTDLVLPVGSGEIDWRSVFPSDSFAGDTRGATHVAIGWGDRGFFLETPTWSDLRFSVALNALLLPSDTCVHVRMTKADWFRANGNVVTITEQQYAKLVDTIRKTLVLSDGKAKPIVDEAYGDTDAFFEARGRYHCLNTCNSWAGRCLKAAGVRTCLFSPLPMMPSLYFPDVPDS